MNVWDYIANHSTNLDSLQYKKWLDLSLSHFSSFELSEDQIPFSIQKKIAKKAIEDFRESGNYLLYLSSNFYSEDNQPIFLTPILPEFSNRNREIKWSLIESFWTRNLNLTSESINLNLEDLEEWISTNSIINQTKCLSASSAIFFNNHTNKFIKKDLVEITKKKQSSQAIESLFNEDIKTIIPDKSNQFLDFIHIMKLDSSQAQAINSAKELPIVISGPPGTGKTQTITNLALEEISLGKKVAILSKKRAAIDVIKSRLDLLDLDHICFSSIEAMLHPEKVLTSFEHSLELIRASKNSEVSEKLNLVYFKHCIRILEDYFEASQFSQSDNFNDKLIKLHRDSNILKWIAPNNTNIHLNINEFNLDLKNLKIILLKLNIDFKDLNFDVLFQLSSIYQMLIPIDRKNLIKFLKDFKSKNRSLKAEKSAFIHSKKKPLKGELLSHISEDKLIFLKNKLINSNLILNHFDKKFNQVKEEINTLITNWNQKEVWSKVEEINAALEFQKWYNEEQELNSKLDSISTYQYPDIFQYIEDKINSSIPVWLFVKQNWLDSNLLDLKDKIWVDLFSLLSKISKFNSEFHTIEISNFISNYISEEKLISNQEWIELSSSYNFSYTNWKSVFQKQNTKIPQPILTNYSFREIAVMANFCRKNYSLYSEYQVSIWKNQFLTKKSFELTKLIKSKNIDDQSDKISWKNSIKFVEKNWSTKRKKTAIFQYINELDLDFLQWLKPLYLGTLDHCSQFFPLEYEIFDTLILDESSQIEVMDALPSLYRSKKVIIVGDNKQLTPSKFFRLTSQYSLMHDNILELAEEKFPKFQLNYHYRSLNSKLILYSNLHFYDNRLITSKFSNPSSILWTYCPEGIYKNRKNHIEAMKIVDILIQLANFKSNETKSIGIISFSFQQKEEIENQLDLAIQSNQKLALFIQNQKSKSEYLFIQNIENVQGDERDIILISSGYAKNELGQFFHYFGPILSYKGENRLNVLMSRARDSIYFISSIKSSDIVLKSTSSNGMKLFKKLFEFLEYSEIIRPNQSIKYSDYWSYFLNPFRK